MKKADYSKENLEKIINNSKSFVDIAMKLNLGIHGNNKIIKKYIKKYNIDISHLTKTPNKFNNKIGISEILIKNSKYNSSNHLKNRLYKENIKEKKCEICGQDEYWQGKHMSLILDHINGINNDNRIENLRIVCPNCNATFETHCRGNAYFKRQETKQNELKEKNKIRYISRRKVERPSYEELKQEILEIGREAVGRKHGVTGNSIRKWIWTYEKLGY